VASEGIGRDMDWAEHAADVHGTWDSWPDRQVLVEASSWRYLLAAAKVKLPDAPLSAKGDGSPVSCHRALPVHQANLEAMAHDAVRTGPLLDSFVSSPPLNAALGLPATAPTGWLVTVPVLTKSIERTPAPMRQTSPDQPGPGETNRTRADVARHMHAYAELHRRPNETRDQAFSRLLGEGDPRMTQLYAWHERTPVR
jgi:hypothetical protein